MPAIVYSTGSSAVRILTSGSFRKFMAPYNVVDFPLPVGPVTKTIPWGAEIAEINSFSCAFVKPMALMLTANDEEFNIRITTLSPRLVGNIEILKSTSVSSFAMYEIFPSCGSLRSAISKFARILILAITAL